MAVTGGYLCKIWLGLVQALCKLCARCGWALCKLSQFLLCSFLSFLTELPFSWNLCGKARMDFEVEMPLTCFIVPSNKEGH